MKRTRLTSLLVVAGVTVGAAVLQQAFLSLLFERTQKFLLTDAGSGLVALAVTLLVALGGLALWLGPVMAFVRDPLAADLPARLAVRRRLARLPGFLLAANTLVFLVLNVTLLATRAASGGVSTFDLVLTLLLGLVFAFLASLHERSWIERLSLPVRRALNLHRVGDGLQDTPLVRRLFLVNLGSVVAAGLLAGMAALGFYREVVTFYTTLSVDATSAATNVSSQAVSSNELKVVGQLGVLFLLILAWTVALTRSTLSSVTKQLQTLRDRVGEMAEGSADLERRAEVLFFDEVGLLTGRINALMGRLQNVVAVIQSTATSVAQSTATVQQASHHANSRVEDVALACERSAQSLSRQREILGQTSRLAADLSATAAEVRQAAAEQNAAVDQGAAAMEEMAATIASVRELTVHAERLGGNLRQTADVGGQSVEAVRTSMGAIRDAAAAVAGTVASIKKVAAQTNLLAMNAAIEAAHAGTSGAGFAVVATEVRTLAESSSQGTRRIVELMKVMNDRIGEGDRLAAEAGEAFHRIFDLIVKTSEVMETVARSMDEQRAGTETLVETTRTLREASLRISDVSERQSEHSQTINQSIAVLVETEAALTAAQSVQAHSMDELTRLVRTVAQEADLNREAADALGQTVKGFSVGATDPT